MRSRMGDGRQMTDDGRQMISNKNPSVLRGPSSTSHQILLRDRGAEAVVVVDEVADELVQAALEDFVDAEVFEARADGARQPLRRSLTAVGGGDPVEVLHQI